ncbi:MAG: hypothetical protein IJ501_06390 [Bacilli bacterium]|nr:hypothetical protein [Bacilli bacterium]
MKKVVYLFCLLVLFSLTFEYKEELLVYYNKYFSSNQEVPTPLIKNEYYRDYNFNYVSNTEDFIPNNKQDILNIYYTVINSGMDNFTFYCSNEYESCINDVRDIANNQVVISNINNYVHPYNGFKDLETEIDSLGKITLNINRNYTDEMKIILNYKIDEIIKNNIKDEMDLREKIKVIHDYIINNTKYDTQRSDSNIINYKSDTAYGSLIEGYALCGGYTDSMMLFLERFGVKNFRISSENHVWNYVYLDNSWYNLDLTWDDPVSKSGKDLLNYDFFLITDEEMFDLDTTEHTYDKNVYN